MLDHYLTTLYAERLPDRDGRDLAWRRLLPLPRWSFVLMLAPGLLAAPRSSRQPRS